MNRSRNAFGDGTLHAGRLGIGRGGKRNVSSVPASRSPTACAAAAWKARRCRGQHGPSVPAAANVHGAVADVALIKDVLSVNVIAVTVEPSPVAD